MSKEKRDKEKGSNVLHWNQFTYADGTFNELLQGTNELTLEKAL